MLAEIPSRRWPDDKWAGVEAIKDSESKRAYSTAESVCTVCPFENRTGVWGGIQWTTGNINAVLVARTVRLHDDTGWATDRVHRLQPQAASVDSEARPEEAGKVELSS